MEIDPNAPLQPQFLVARNVMASGLVRESYADGQVSLTIAPAAVTRSEPAFDLPPALTEADAAAPAIAAPEPAAVTLPAAVLADAVRQADAALNPAAQNAPPPAAANPDAALTGAAVLRHALIGLMTDLEAHDNSAAAQQKIQEDAQRIITAASDTFADMAKRNALIEVLAMVVKELEKRKEDTAARSTAGKEETAMEGTEEDAEAAEQPASGEAGHPVEAAIKQIYADAAHAYSSHAEVPFRI